MFCTTGWSGIIKLWTTTGQHLRSLKCADTDTRCHGLAFSSECSPKQRALAANGHAPGEANGQTEEKKEVTPFRLAAAMADGTIQIWDESSNKELVTLHGHEERVNRVVFVPNNEVGRCGAGGNDRVIQAEAQALS